MNNMTWAGYLASAIILVVIITYSLFSGHLQSFLHETLDLDSKGGVEKKIIPISSNYDVAPPEIKKFEEKIDEK